METIRIIHASDNVKYVVSPDKDVGGWVQISSESEGDESVYIVFDPKHAKDIAKAILLCAEELAE
jgi:hypothetical protein